MNALFLTQGRSLGMFFDLMNALGSIERAGFYVADRQYFREFSHRHSDIESRMLVKEWEILQRSSTGHADVARLRMLERELAAPNLMKAIVADRRIYLGPLCTLRQDYRSRFTQGRMLRILEVGIDAISDLFDRVQPDVVFSFICVTFGEYLACLIARRRGVPFLNLRPTRVDNHVTLAPGISEPSEFIAAELAGAECQVEGNQASIDEATRYLARVRAGSNKYEGVIPVSRRPPPARRFSEELVPRLRHLVHAQWSHMFGETAGDNHLPAPVQQFFYRRVANPARAWITDARLRSHLVTRTDLGNKDYAFFPLHTEPEISLLVHSPEHLNQIEVVRALSHNLPAGQSLLVKEHPASIGKRPISYYRKLLDIPNVGLADPGLDSTTLITNARLVATIAGSIGLEAALRGIPVVTLGDTPYELLPNTMVRRVRALCALGSEIADLVQNYRYDERAVIDYLAATIRCSAPINLYSTLLGRSGVHVPGPQRTWDDEIQSLAELSRRMLSHHVQTTGRPPRVVSEHISQ